VRAGEYHLTGHFTRWGESVLTDPHPLQRPLVAARTFLVFGLGSLPAPGWARVLATLAWTGIALVAMKQRWRSRPGLLVALWFVPDASYLFLAHDVAFPRYWMPATAVSCLCAGVAIARRPRPGLAAGAVALVSMTIVSHHLALSRRAHPPVEYSVVDFVRKVPRGALGVVDVPTLPFFLTNVAPGLTFANAPPPRIANRVDQWTAEGRRIFLTQPPPDPTGWQPVAHFCLDPLVDPRPPHEMWLFSRTPPEDGGAALHGCDGL
jgi:hypothetical protein